MNNIIDREEFIKSIKSDVFKEMIHQYFDESMALYDLISDKIKVENMYAGSLKLDSNKSLSDNNEFGIIFSIDAKTKKNAVNIENIIKSYKVSCYDHNYSVETEVEKSKIHIKFKDEVSG